MITFDNIKTYSIDFPKTWSFLGSAEEAQEISQEHKDQIIFLNKEASDFVRDYLKSSKMVSGKTWKPFNERYFIKVEEYETMEKSLKEIKKWLYQKPIPFDKYVFISNSYYDLSVALTWKMVIKYCGRIFSGSDKVIFDESLNWGLYHFHEEILYFGSDKIYDKEFEYEKTQELNEIKKKFFNKDKPGLDEEAKLKSILVFKEKYNTDRMQ